MEVRYVTPMKWILHRNRLLAYMAKHGEGSLTAECRRILADLDPVALGYPDTSGAAIAVLRDSGQLLGVAAAVDWGHACCIVVTHPSSRGQEIGSRLQRALVTRIGKLHCDQTRLTGSE
jgi:GNAT superfamily N-acetyltransferase